MGNSKLLYEVMDFKLLAPSLSKGSVPLLLIAEIVKEIRSVVGYAALRLIQDGMNKHNIPKKSLHEHLDLRLSEVRPNFKAVHLIITANSERDLLNDGVVKKSLERIFSVLNTNGYSPNFLPAITKLGPSSAKHLRKFLSLMLSNSIEIDFIWRFSELKIGFWKGTKRDIKNLHSALEVKKIIERKNLILVGKISMLNKQKRIHLKNEKDKPISIFYPDIMFSEISRLCLDDEVTLECQFIKIINSITDELSVSYELLKIKS